MSNKTSRYTSQFIGAAVGLLAGVAFHLPAVADDTEIYQATLSASGSARPKVLIIMDDSGSMGIQAQAGGVKPDYDPNETYADAGFDNSRVYWSSNSSKPPPGTSRWFAASSNRCESSYTALANEGSVTTKAKRWVPANGSMQTVTRNVCHGTQIWWWCVPGGWSTETTTEWVGDDAAWESLSNSDQTPVHVDCQADVLGAEEGNGPGQSDGLPNQPSTPNAPNSEAYTTSGSSNVNYGSTTYRWYSAHYLNYWNDSSIVSVAKTRLQVAQEVVNTLVNTNPSIDFGLEVFNDNTDGIPIRWCGGGSSGCTVTNTEEDNGGRIVHAIIEDMTDADRLALAGSSGLINSISASGATPLCESAYEAYRYLAGKSQVYGNKGDSTNGHYSIGQDPTIDSPAVDSRAYIGGTGNIYKSPNSDCAYSYIILLTDGFPTYDRHANAAVETLTGNTCADYLSDETNNFGQRLMVKNCLPELARYMSNNDLDQDASNGDQFAITYTIGFATDQQMLQDAASLGKGQYFTAETSDELAAAFEAAIFGILSTETSFTSPSVAVNTFTRTESRNEVFFAMFQPNGTKNWPGNIKRLDIRRTVDINGVVTKELVDKNNAPAIDDDGLISGTAETLWSTSQDGPKVDEGGVGQLLAASNLTTRAARIWTNTGSGGALELFSVSNITPDAYGFDVLFPSNPLFALTAFWGVDNQAELTKSILWGIGYDTDDEDNDTNTTEKRDWIMADILHSRPRVVSYGALGSFTEANPDLRILVGTNAGFLHMFGNDNGQEDWAFFPKELGSVLTTRRENEASSARPYGIDSPPVIYSYDDNKDGTLNHSVGDKVWAFFGLRRGGRAIYALDISNPNSPSFMWQIASGDTGFTHLGQTWSIPRVARIPGYADATTGIPKPVLIFAGGYDTNKDDHATLGTANDTLGRGIYIVDAETGALVWSVTPGADSATNMQATELAHSIPAPVAILDSNGDRLVDRIYVGDTAGILWRVDMPGDTLPTSSQDTWRLTKLFTAVDPAVTRTQENDRRFYNQPDVVRVEYKGVPADAVLIGTGDRSNPGAVDDSNAANTAAVQNEFYMIRDLGVTPVTTDYDSNDCMTALVPDFRCALPQDNTDLFDATDNALQDGTTAEKAAAETAFEGAQGWRIQLEGEGEKSLSRSVTIQGKVFFGTFTPGVGAANLCEPAAGLGKLYIVSLYDATAVLDFDNDDVLDRNMNLGNQIPDAPAIHVDEDGKITIIPPQGDRPGDADLIDTESEIPAPYGSYWYREEY